MKISVEYDKDLKNRLLSTGFTEEALCEASEAVSNLFLDVARQVYQKTLKRPLPDAVEVAVRSDALMEGKKSGDATISATCSLKISEDDILRFSVCESLIRGVLERQKPNNELIATVTHEMVHSANAEMIHKAVAVLVELEVATMGVKGPLEEADWHRRYGLLLVLTVMHHFLQEGVAMVGACLLAKCRFEAASDDLHVFRRIFVRTLRQAMREVWEQDDFDFQEWVNYKTYEIAPDILTLVLTARGTISPVTAKKMLHGFETGNYELTDQEVRDVMQAAVSLSLPEYVQGLLTPNKTGQVIGHLPTFFDYCVKFQEEVRVDAVTAFCKLIQQPIYAATDFIETMQVILEKPDSEGDLDIKCGAFYEHPMDKEDYPDIVDKVMKLQSVMKTAEQAEKRLVARWALTYFFSEQGLVSNDIPVLGRMDDLLVMDRALKTIEGNDIEALARFLISQNTPNSLI